jgi:O-antigen/teichoic acid export membrane protein
MLFLSLTQAMMALLPLASQLHMAGQEAEVNRWFSLLQRFGVVLAMVICGGVWGMAPALAVPIFGPAYEPVIETMSIGVVGLAVMMLGYPAGMLAVVWREPKLRLWAGFLALIAALLGMSLVPLWRANGATTAVVLGTLTYTLTIWYVVRQRSHLAWGQGLLGILAGVVFLPLFWLDGMISSLITFEPTQAISILLVTFTTAALATGVCILLYLGLVFALRVISWREIRLVIKTIRR